MNLSLPVGVIRADLRLWLRDGIDPQSLVTFQNLATLSRRRLDKALRRYSEKVRITVARISRTAAGTDSCR